MPYLPWLHVTLEDLQEWPALQDQVIEMKMRRLEEGRAGPREAAGASDQPGDSERVR